MAKVEGYLMPSSSPFTSGILEDLPKTHSCHLELMVVWQLHIVKYSEQSKMGHPNS